MADAFAGKPAPTFGMHFPVGAAVRRFDLPAKAASQATQVIRRKKTATGFNRMAVFFITKKSGIAPQIRRNRQVVLERFQPAEAPAQVRSSLMTTRRHL
ncbi:hypothetical protein [Pseudomonas fluorescens]|uniref:hypothetical protein n=1 Tax=Pseudomonas TaxID=286 RepID=UPI00146B7BB1|nr:hypothetical protein [Pseudomonas fluorescens]